MSELVKKSGDDEIFVGPLTRKQYQVIIDSLELAAAWTERDSSPITARTLRGLIPDVGHINDNDGSMSSGPAKLVNQMPKAVEVIPPIEEPSDES